MNRWRHHKLYKLGRILVLLLLLGQSALLIHQSAHTGTLADTECQVCLHGQPHFSVGDIAPVVADYSDHTSLTVVHLEQPGFASPDYTNGSRAPPFS